MAIDHDLKLPKGIRNTLKQTLGPVISGKLPDKYLKHRPLIAVGDFVNNVLYDQGIRPDLGIVDGHTRRGIYEGNIPEFDEKIEVDNPPTEITAEAWEAVEEALSSKESFLI